MRTLLVTMMLLTAGTAGAEMFYSPEPSYVIEERYLRNKTDSDIYSAEERLQAMRQLQDLRDTETSRRLDAMREVQQQRDDLEPLNPYRR